jgi:cellulose synthase operon protein C
MAGTKIRLTWGNRDIAGARWRFWLFALKPADLTNLPGEKISRRQETRNILHISLRTIALMMFFMAVTGYFAAAYALLHVQSKNPYNRITYGDLILPWRWSGLDAMRGAALIDQARAELKEGQIATGASRLRMGLERNPADAQARADLSYIYILRRLRTHSDRLLLEAFDHGYPGSEYVNNAHRTITFGDVPAKELLFLEKARAALAAAGGPAEDGRLIDTLMIETLLRLERHEEAARIGHRIYPENSTERSELDVRIALAAGDFARAASAMDQWRTLRPDSADVLTRAADVYRRAGRLADMQACIDRLRKLAPVNPAHASLNIVQNLLAGRDELAGAALEDGLFRFGADSRVLAVWARDITETGRDDFLVRLEAFIQEQGHSLNPVLFARLLAQIRGRNWVKARESVLRIREREARMPEAERRQIDVVTSLALACADAGGGYQQVFIAAYQRSPVSLEFNRTIIEALLDAGRWETADRLVTLVLGVYPESRYLTETAQRIGERLIVLEKQKEAARPVAEASPAANFTDAPSLLAELARLGQQGQIDAGLSLVRAVRKQGPAWLAANEDAVSLSELDLAFRADDITLLQLTVRTYLRNQPGTSRGQLMKRAADWHQQDRKAEALMVLREILKAEPAFKPALQALEAWEPKPEPVVDEAR